MHPPTARLPLARPARPPVRRLWRFGLGLHLIKGTPVPRPAAIDPKSDHCSFVGAVDEVQAALASRGIPYVRQEVVEGGQLVSQVQWRGGAGRGGAGRGGAGRHARLVPALRRWWVVGRGTGQWQRQ